MIFGKLGGNPLYIGKRRSLKDRIAKNFETTWYVKKWNNVEPEGPINYNQFEGTKLIKGFGIGSFVFGEPWKIHMIMGPPSPYFGVHTSKLPYNLKNQSIMLHLTREQLEELYASGGRKFKCTYHYHYGL